MKMKILKMKMKISILKIENIKKRDSIFCILSLFFVLVVLDIVFVVVVTIYLFNVVAGICIGLGAMVVT